MMNDNRTKNAMRNIIFGLINKVVMLVFPFVIRTVLIKKLGIEYLGLNSLFTSILQVLNLTELGFSTAVVFSMYKPIVENDKDTICALMNLYKKIYRVIGIMILILGLILLPFLNRFINGSYPEAINIRILYLIYLLNTVLTYFLFAYKTALLSAHQRVDISMKINTLVSIAQYVLQIIVLFTIKNYYIYVLIITFTTIINNLVSSYIVSKKYPEYIAKGKINKELVKNIKKRVAGLMVSKVCQTTRNSLDSIFISSFIGLNAVAIYGNYLTIMNSVIALLAILPDSMLAGIGNSIASESSEKNHEDMNKFNFIYMWISGICTVCMLCLYQPFMKLWMGEEFLFPIGIVVLFCIYFYSLKMGDIKSAYLTSAGLWWESRYRAIAESIANVLLNLILGKLFGIYGILFATLISLLVINFGYGSQIIYNYYFKNKKLLNYFKNNLIYAIITAINCITVYYLTIKLPNLNPIVNLLLIGVICITLPNIIYFLTYKNLKEFKESKDFIFDIINTKLKIK